MSRTTRFLCYFFGLKFASVLFLTLFPSLLWGHPNYHYVYQQQMGPEFFSLQKRCQPSEVTPTTTTTSNNLSSITGYRLIGEIKRIVRKPPKTYWMGPNLFSKKVPALRGHPNYYYHQQQPFLPELDVAAIMVKTWNVEIKFVKGPA